MTRSIEEVQRVLELTIEGRNISQIARKTGISRTTIRGWLNGGIPSRGPGRGLVPASAEGTCPRCGHERHWISPAQQPSYAYLLGMYLGDGCISLMPKRVYTLRIVLDSRYPGVAQECAHAVSQVMPRNTVAIAPHRQERAVEVRAYSKQWPCLFPQAGPGRKHKRPIYLADWQREITHELPGKLLRGLIHSDGCRFVNPVTGHKERYEYPRYNFSNRSSHIRDIFCEHCELLGIDWRQMNWWDISVARRESVALLDQLVGPKF